MAPGKTWLGQAQIVIRGGDKNLSAVRYQTRISGPLNSHCAQFFARYVLAAMSHFIQIKMHRVLRLKN
jgi:hypothetical protein